MLCSLPAWSSQLPATVIAASHATWWVVWQYRRPSRHSHEAFSMFSLMSGAEQGYYDLESVSLLRFIDDHPDRQVRHLPGPALF
jgi:hypothetical protein